MKDELKAYDLKIRNSDAPDAQLIDFEIYDDEDNVAWVWGDSPDEVEVECTHPAQCVSFDDDEPCGWCELCGATCNAQYLPDVGDVEGYAWSGRCLSAVGWETPDEPGGVIGKYLKELAK